MSQDGWRSRSGFILAAMGSAIGLGNIWRFPFMAYKNGGGAFLIPYAVSVAVVGFSLMLAELTIGHKYRSAQPTALAKERKGWESAGWWAIGVGYLGVTVYYCVVIGWTVNYFFYALNLAWDPNPQKFFFESYLGLSKDPWAIGGLRLPIVISTAFVWTCCWRVVSRGIAKGVESAIRLMMPLLFVLLFILVIWSLNLPGAALGLKAYFTPDFSKLASLKVWGEALGQTFFSLSLGFGIMAAYARYLPKDTNLATDAAWIVIGDSVFAIAAGIVVFSTLGFMAQQSGVGIDKVVKGGPGLVFVVFPKAISSLPGLKSVFGGLFFLTLFLAGMTSAISLIEALVSAMRDKFGITRARVTAAACTIGFIGSLAFTTDAGLLWLDIIDHHITQYGLISSSILVSIFAGWIMNKSETLDHVRAAGSTWVGGWWIWLLRYPVVLILLILLGGTMMEDLNKPYGGYPLSAILILGWAWLAFILVIAYVLTNKKQTAAA